MCHLQPHKIQDETTGTVDVPDLELTKYDVSPIELCHHQPTVH